MSSIGAAVEAAVKRLIRQEMKQALKGLRAEIRASGRSSGPARPAAARSAGRGGRVQDAGPVMAPKDVKALRARLGMTQAQFAKTMGVTHVAVYFWESGRTKPTGARLAKLNSLAKGGAGTKAAKKKTRRKA